MNNLTVNDIVSDTLLSNVFEGTRFGRDHREVVLTELLSVSKGNVIGYTAKCCLQELGLITIPKPRKTKITTLGMKYLAVANNTGLITDEEDLNQPRPQLKMF